tara:strand:- start:10520 stop:12286 length:1767 start_codon:yes stop_codon:yes gene_type:complete
MSNINTPLELKPIGELLDFSFNIPSYQRGYRWKGAFQVKDLLEDIWDYKVDSSNPKAFYCLQPIVVKPINDSNFELIDGQQRLTTILLLLHYFNETEFKLPKKCYSIDFETRLMQRDFLSKVDDEKYSESNIDLFHINQAYSYICKWFDKMEVNTSNPSIRGDFYSKLINKVKVIWYSIQNEVNEETSVYDIFTRLNIGKIPLTNAELIKALFLSKYGSDFDSESRYLKQINIATEWDKIEQTLQKEDFWYFICNQPEKYETRIEFIFDLIKKKGDEDEAYFTFHKFIEEFDNLDENSKSIDKVWLNVKEYFLTFEEWYNEQELYHLVGYLITTGHNINVLKEKSTGISKTVFKNWLRKKALESIPKTELFESLNYYRDRYEIRKTLLLFNIFSILENPKSSLRFPFNFFHKQKWDIEHISSQTSKQISGKDRENWAITNLEYFTGTKWNLENEEQILDVVNEIEEEEEKSICIQLISIIKKEDSDHSLFNEVFDSLQSIFEYGDKIDDPDGLNNLALLDEGTNRMYKNAFFPVKRQHIIQKEKQAVYIPLCTRNVFLKAYSKKLSEVMFWNNNDSISYLTEIKNILQ